MTTEQAAEELNVSVYYVQKLCQAGRLGNKIGRQWLITREELETFKKSRRPRGRPRNS